ncbi:hypothetical protein BDZ91DRAFT_758498 [Kalaharituber pfeilii]|nr:hypothetical protein BDZ91DRAFT_758498 [Kalaharituber pfeilii]
MKEVTGVKRKSLWSVPNHPKFSSTLGEGSSNAYAPRGEWPKALPNRSLVRSRFSGPLTRLTSLLRQSWKCILTPFLAALFTLFDPQLWPQITYSIDWVWRCLQGESAYEEDDMDVRFNNDSDDEGYAAGSTEVITLGDFVTADDDGNRLRTDGGVRWTGSGVGEVEGAGAGGWRRGLKQRRKSHS